MVPTNRPLLLAALLALASCAPPAPVMPELPRLTVAAGFGPKNLCGLGVSPAIAITGAPNGTTRYRVRMSNLDVLWQTAWQDTLPAGEGGVTEGASVSYPPPCLGTFQQYRYRFEVLALDSGERPLAYGQTTALAVPLDRLVRQQPTPAPSNTGPDRAPTSPTVLEREDDTQLFGTSPYRNPGPIVAPYPPQRD